MDTGARLGNPGLGGRRDRQMANNKGWANMSEVKLSSEAEGGDANSPAPIGFSTLDIAGVYAFRFSGFTMKNNILHYLAGLGRWRIDENGNLIGSHRFSTTELQGAAAALTAGSYDSNGTIILDGDGSGMGSASITFTLTSGEGKNIDGTFHVTVAGTADRLWLVSKGATVMPSGTQADELVNVEAIRIAGT
jgi:hypothetical protein